MWTEEYWDIQRRAFWGIRRYFAKRITPLCLDCAANKPDPSKHSFSKFDQRLRNEEVFLNDILNLLMRLAPQCLYKLLVEYNFDLVIGKDDYFESLGNGYRSHLNVNANITQPDFFAVGHGSTFAIELKLGAKTDLRQVLLYLALAAANEQKIGREQQHFLLLLTPNRSFCNVWKERFANLEEVRSAFSEAASNPSCIAPKQSAFLHQYDLPSILSRFHLAHMTFTDFAFALDSLRPPAVRSSADEVLDKLLGDAASEMRKYDR